MSWQGWLCASFLAIMILGLICAFAFVAGKAMALYPKELELKRKQDELRRRGGCGGC